MADWGVQVTGLEATARRFALADQLIPQVAGRVLTTRLMQAVTYAKERYLTGGTTSDRLAVRSGVLRAAFMSRVTLSAGGAQGQIGYAQGPASAYAATHEGWPNRRSSTTIKAKKTQYLAIPLAAAKTPAGVARGRPRDFPNTFVARSKRGALLIFQRTGKGTIMPLFLLKKEVIIPARPALYPTVDKFLPLIREDIQREVTKVLGG